MNKLRLAAVAAIMGGIAIFASAPAQAYPDVVIVLTADTPVIGGKTVHFTADTTAHNVQCKWTVEFDDGVASTENDTRTGTGLSLSGSYKSKPVKKKTKTTMTATCVYDNAVAPTVASITSGNAVTPAIYSSKPAASLQAADVTLKTSTTVILLPLGGGGDDTGALPDTGGSNLSWIYIGGALVLVGGGVTYAARRRQSAR